MALYTPGSAYNGDFAKGFSGLIDTLKYAVGDCGTSLGIAFSLLIHETVKPAGC